MARRSEDRAERVDRRHQIRGFGTFGWRCRIDSVTVKTKRPGRGLDRAACVAAERRVSAREVNTDCEATLSTGTTPADAAPTGSASLSVFTRRSSGLVRSFSLTDAVIYGILACGCLYQLLYVFPGPQVTLSGLSLPLAYAISALFYPAVFALYAALGSAMPRTGGDYLYQSRFLHPALGFGFGFAWEVFLWVTFTTTGALLVAQLGMQPLLFNLAYRLDAPSLLSVSDWFGSDTGFFVTAMAVTLVGFGLTLAGLGFYGKLQKRVLFPIVVLSNVLLIVLLARSHSSFLSNFDAFAAQDPKVLKTSAQITQEAAADGFKAPGFSLWHTLLFQSITFGTAYVMFAAQGLLGETKQASNYNRLFRAFMIGGAYVAVVSFVLPTFLFEHAAGRDFTHAYASVIANGGTIPSGGATVPALTMMMTSSPVLVIILSLGFIIIGFYFATCVFLNMTRVMCAMGMDRSLPEWFSKVNQRFHVPVNAAIFFAGMAVAFNALYVLVPSVQLPMLLGGAFTSVAMVGLTGLAGVLFVLRGGEVYRSSPVYGKKLLGIPIPALAGGITFLFSGTVTVLNLVIPDLGFTSDAARILLLVSLALSIAWFYAYRSWLRSRHGVNLDLAFKTIPPE
jgi:APA family basic amino acid/polyamine antiporter